MAMHIVLGDGEMTRKELTETLKDLWQSVEGQPFWFILQGKSEPTDTDKAMVAWLHKNEVYYEVLTDDEEAMSDIYSQSQNTHTAKRLAQKVVSLLQNSPEGDPPESATLLALFYDVNDAAAEQDRWLNSVIQSVLEAGFKVLGFNDGLVEIEFDAGVSAPEAEAEAAPAKVAGASKVPAKKAGPPGQPLNIPAKAPKPTHTREELEELDLTALKAIAAEQGIVLPARTRMVTYIAHILGEVTEEAVPVAEVLVPDEVTAPSRAASNGNGHGPVDIDALVEQIIPTVLDVVIEKLVTALKS